MSWGNGAIMSLAEIKMKAGQLPCEYQLGEPVCFWIEDGEAVTKVDAYVVGVTIMNMHKVRYDLAFQIGNTEYYAVIKDVRGRITHQAEGFKGVDMLDDPTQKLPVNPRPALFVVPTVVPKNPPADQPE